MTNRSFFGSFLPEYCKKDAYEFSCEDYEPYQYIVRYWKGDSVDSVRDNKLHAKFKPHLELLPILPDGYRWMKLDSHYFALVKHKLAPERDIQIYVFGDSIANDYLTVIDGQTRQAVAQRSSYRFSNLKDESYYPMKSQDFHSPAGHFIRGHLIDFRDTKGNFDQDFVSTKLIYNYYPEPGIPLKVDVRNPWGGHYRNRLVSDILPGYHYIQHNFYDDAPIVLNGDVHVPKGIMFQTQFLDTFAKYIVPWDHSIHREPIVQKSGEKSNWLRDLHDYGLLIPSTDQKNAPLPVFYDPKDYNAYSNLYSDPVYPQNLKDCDFLTRYRIQVAADRHFDSVNHQFMQLLFECEARVSDFCLVDDYTGDRGHYEKVSEEFIYHLHRFNSVYSNLLDFHKTSYITTEMFAILFQKVNKHQYSRHVKRFLEEFQQNFKDQIDGTRSLYDMSGGYNQVSFSPDSDSNSVSSGLSAEPSSILSTGQAVGSSGEATSWPCIPSQSNSIPSSAPSRRTIRISMANFHISRATDFLKAFRTHISVGCNVDLLDISSNHMHDIFELVLSKIRLPPKSVYLRFTFAEEGKNSRKKFIERLTTLSWIVLTDSFNDQNALLSANQEKSQLRSDAQTNGQTYTNGQVNSQSTATHIVAKYNDSQLPRPSTESQYWEKEKDENENLSDIGNLLAGIADLLDEAYYRPEVLQKFSGVNFRKDSFRRSTLKHQLQHINSTIQSRMEVNESSNRAIIQWRKKHITEFDHLIHEVNSKFMRGGILLLDNINLDFANRFAKAMMFQLRNSNPLSEMLHELAKSLSGSKLSNEKRSSLSEKIPSRSVEVYFTKTSKKDSQVMIMQTLEKLPWVFSAKCLENIDDYSAPNFALNPLLYEGMNTTSAKHPYIINLRDKSKGYRQILSELVKYCKFGGKLIILDIDHNKADNIYSGLVYGNLPLRSVEIYFTNRGTDPNQVITEKLMRLPWAKCAYGNMLVCDFEESSIYDSWFPFEMTLLLRHNGKLLLKNTDVTRAKYLRDISKDLTLPAKSVEVVFQSPLDSVEPEHSVEKITNILYTIPWVKSVGSNSCWFKFNGVRLKHLYANAIKKEMEVILSYGSKIYFENVNLEIAQFLCELLSDVQLPQKSIDVYYSHHDKTSGDSQIEELFFSCRWVRLVLLANIFPVSKLLPTISKYTSK